MDNELQPINFHNDTIFLVEHNNQPFTPLKPICENIGIDWKVQHRKLTDPQGRRWTIHHMTTVAEDGKQRKMICLPLRKVAGWLMTISPSKVRPEIKDRLIAYQNECDEVLWSYWIEGAAINERALPAGAMVIDKDEYIRLLKDKIEMLEIKATLPRRHRSPRPFTDAERREIIELYKKGLTQAQIAAQLDRSAALISMTVRAYSREDN